MFHPFILSLSQEIRELRNQQSMLAWDNGRSLTQRTQTNLAHTDMTTHIPLAYQIQDPPVLMLDPMPCDNPDLDTRRHRPHFDDDAKTAVAAATVKPGITCSKVCPPLLSPRPAAALSAYVADGRPCAFDDVNVNPSSTSPPRRSSSPPLSAPCCLPTIIRGIPSSSVAMKPPHSEIMPEAIDLQHPPFGFEMNHRLGGDSVITGMSSGLVIMGAAASTLDNASGEAAAARDDETAAADGRRRGLKRKPVVVDEDAAAAADNGDGTRRARCKRGDGDPSVQQI